jgi:hypothetical protein
MLGAIPFFIVGAGEGWFNLKEMGWGRGLLLYVKGVPGA